MPGQSHLKRNRNRKIIKINLTRSSNVRHATEMCWFVLKEKSILSNPNAKRRSEPATVVVL